MAEPTNNTQNADPTVRDGKHLMLSESPSYNVLVKPAEMEEAVNTRGRVFNREVKASETVQFANHRAWVTPAQVAALRKCVDYWYGIHFIAASDLRAKLESPDSEKRKEGKEFIVRMGRKDVIVRNEPVTTSDDVMAEIGVDLKKTRGVPAGV